MIDQVRFQIWLDEHQALCARYADNESYYDGSGQEAKLTDRARTFLESNGFVNFRVNVCCTVVDSMVGRLRVTNYAGVDDFDDWAWELWRLSGLATRQGSLYRDALVYGDAYLIGEWYTDPLRKVSYPRFRINDPRNCYMVYDENDVDKPIAFLKRWPLRPEVSGGPLRWRLNIYTDNMITRYSGAYGEDAATIVWKVIDSKVWKAGVIPAVHLVNRRSSSSHGSSELKNVIPIQDLLNKGFIDLSNILDQQGWPQRYSTGGQPPDGGYTSAVGIVWNLPAETGSFGQFAAANPVGVLKAIEADYSAVSAVSRTPQHAFHTPGDRFPSGEALKTAEVGLIEKCEGFASDVGEQFEQMMRVSVAMQKAYGEWPPKSLEGVEKPKKKYTFDISSQLECQWRDFETRNELVAIQSVNLKGPNISHTQRLREYGYSDPDIERIKEELAVDAAAAALLQPAETTSETSPGLSTKAVVQPGLSSIKPKSTTEQDQPKTQQRD